MLFLIFSCFNYAYAKPKNIILFVGDGMGYEQVRAARLYAHGFSGVLLFEAFPFAGESRSASADSDITDSAAAATALATGKKVNNGVVGLAIPGDGRELLTALEFHRAQGRATGLITTSFLTDATPAAFAAHEPHRTNYDEIAADYLTQTRPTVMLGGGGYGLDGAAAEAAGYTVVTDRAGMNALSGDESAICGLFSEGSLPFEFDGDFTSVPHLSELTAFALSVLGDGPSGFFLLVESELIDTSGHSNEIERNVFEVLELEQAVSTAYQWASGRDDTLIVVTADHETGGLSILEGYGTGQFPSVMWTTSGHTAATVPIYAWGPLGEKVLGQRENACLHAVLLLKNERAIYDFDGDGISDLWAYDDLNGSWYLDKSCDGTSREVFGFMGTLPAVGDYDGDGRADIGVYYPPTGSWHVFQSRDGYKYRQFGFSGTVPVVGDYDGDGRSDTGVYHAPTGSWYLFRSRDGFKYRQFGYDGTVPVVGDYDGDGLSDTAVYHPDSGGWYLFQSGEGFKYRQFGFGGTVPVVGDYDGDGRDDTGVYFSTTGDWHLFQSREGYKYRQFGFPGTIPMVGDFDGDGRADTGVYHPPAREWYLFQSTDGFRYRLWTDP